MPNSKAGKTEKEAQRNLEGVFGGREKFLPMPHPIATKQGPVSAKERAEYLQRKLLHLEQNDYSNEQYEQCFKRPTNETVKKIWERLECHLPEGVESSKTGILSSYSSTKAGKAERDDLIKVAKQAFVITLDTFVTAADNNDRTTYNDVFDALCRSYSDHYHDDKFLAKSARDMSEYSAFKCRRDMLINGVDVNKIYKFVLGWSKGKCPFEKNPLFDIVERWESDGYGSVKSRMEVELSDQKKGDQYKILEDFKGLLIEDHQYQRRKPSHLEIWFADSDTESEFDPSVKYEVCLDRSYNEVPLGANSKRLLEIQWDTRLLFDVSAFKDDYSTALKLKSKCRAELMHDYEFDPEPGQDSSDTSAKRRSSKKQRRNQHLKQILDVKVPDHDEVNENHVKRFLELLAQYDRADQFCIAFKHVNKKIQDDNKDGPNPIPIRSAFHRTRNRRYQPEHLWPVQVSKRDEEIIPDDSSRADFPTRGSENYRHKWFKAKDPEGKACDLKALDISSSQVQIIAALMGIEELESKSMRRSGEQPFKKFLTEIVWEKHRSRNKKFSLKTIDDAISDLKKQEESAKSRGQYEQAARIRLGMSRLIDRGDYECDNDERLVELVKKFMLRTLYGGNLRHIVWEQRDDPETYGPGWDEANAKKFQEDLFSDFPKLKDFLNACKQIVKNKELTAHGVKFTDPSDSVPFRWNPVHRAGYFYSNGDYKLELRMPGYLRATGDYKVQSKNPLFSMELNEGTDLDTQILSKMWRQTFNDEVKVEKIEKIESGAGDRWLVTMTPRKKKEKFLAIRHESAVKIYRTTRDRKFRRSPLQGDSLPVDTRKLGSMIAPCLVQALDAYYSSVVMRKLQERGITAFVGIHDCWMVPEWVQTVVDGEATIAKGLDVLKEVMSEADDEWYDGLGPVYDDLLIYLGNHKKYGPFIRCARDKWEHRHGKGNPPHFLYAEE